MAVCVLGLRTFLNGREGLAAALCDGLLEEVTTIRQYRGVNPSTLEFDKPGKGEARPPVRLVVSINAGDDWPEQLQRLGGHIYHSNDWADTRRSNHSRPLFFSWSGDNERCLGIAVGVESWSPIPYLGRFSKRLDFETYPATHGSDVNLARLMIAQIIQYAKCAGYRSLAIQSYCSNTMVPDLDQLGLACRSRIEFITDLSLSDDELWQRLSPHHRRKIGKAEKCGLAIQENPTSNALSQLLTLMIQSRDRRAERGEYYELPEHHTFEGMGKRLFSENLARVYLVTHGNRIVSGALITVYAGRALYVFGGTNEEGFRLNAPALLFWKLFSRLRALGCTELNFGGVPASSVDPTAPSHGLYRFKSGYGGRQVACLSGSMENLRPVLGWVIAWIKKGWTSS